MLHNTGGGRVVAVTLTRELAPGRIVTTVLSPGNLPAGLFFSPSAVATHMAEEQRSLRRCLYRRPARRG